MGEGRVFSLTNNDIFTFNLLIYEILMIEMLNMIRCFTKGTHKNLKIFLVQIQFHRQYKFGNEIYAQIISVYFVIPIMCFLFFSIYNVLLVLSVFSLMYIFNI